MSRKAVQDYKNVTLLTVVALRRCRSRGIIRVVSAESTAVLLTQALEGSGVDSEQVAGLAGSLVWRIGRLADDAPVTVRVGSTQALQQFSELPRLRSASDQELEEALQDGSLKVEWVGPRL